jgi:hypothetical protein
LTAARPPAPTAAFEDSERTPVTTRDRRSRGSPAHRRLRNGHRGRPRHDARTDRARVPQPSPPP